MGYPLSTFQQLAQLCRNGYYDEAFNRYKLVSILVFGPQDRSVKTTLKYNFERLHVSTGEDFAFIAFLNPPERWKQDHRYWMNKVDELSCDLSTDENRIISSLRSRFNLPQSPCILLTDDLRSNRFAIIPTSSYKLVRQMEEIGRYASGRNERFPINDKEFSLFLSHFESVFIEETENGESVAKNIADILAIDNLFYKSKKYPDSNYYIRKDAECWVSETLNELSHQTNLADEDHFKTLLKRYADYLSLAIATFDSSHADDEDGEHDRLNQDRHTMPTADTLASLLDAQRFRIPEQFDSFMTDYSKEIRQNYNCILPFIYQNWISPCGIYPDYISSSRTSFAPLGLYMGLIIEEEINASIVQLSRKNAGIQMPEFYRLWDEGNANLPPIDTVFINGRGKRIGRNKFMVKSIPIGQAVFVVRTMNQTNPGLGFGYFGEDPFLSRIGEFAKHRNMADHPGIYYEKNTFIEAHRAFASICEKDLPNMASLKATLDGRAFHR